MPLPQWLGGKPSTVPATAAAESNVEGGEVHVNREIPLEKRLDRAKNRVYSLSRKLGKLKKKPQTLEVTEAIEQTEEAIRAWNEQFQIATFEMQLKLKRKERK